MTLLATRPLPAIAIVLGSVTIPMSAARGDPLPTVEARSAPTNFAIRGLDGSSLRDTALTLYPPARAMVARLRPAMGPIDLAGVAAIGARWGRVTSLRRSAAHNRAVGGVPNSWHLHGRAIDIARRPGVVHAQIAAAFRAAGYRLIESLDEGDHSHFAFAARGASGLSAGGGAGVEEPSGPRPQLVKAEEAGATVFRMVFAPPAAKARPARVAIDPARGGAPSAPSAPPVARIAMGDEARALR